MVALYVIIALQSFATNACCVWLTRQGFHR